jgi:hypothetical protein
MVRGTNKWQVEKEDGDRLLVWVDQDMPKGDLTGRQPQLRRKAVAIPIAWLVASPDKVQMSVGEEDMIYRMTGAFVRSAGEVSSVTAVRRSVAATTREEAEDLGLDDVTALGLVRDVLDHAPTSQSTWRYLPRRLGAAAKMNLGAIAMKRT